MNANDIVNEVMKLRNHTKVSLSRKLGFSTPSGVSEKLRTKQGMRIDTLVKFLEAMDCEVIVRSILADKSTWVVTLEDEVTPEPKKRRSRKSKGDSTNVE